MFASSKSSYLEKDQIFPNEYLTTGKKLLIETLVEKIKTVTTEKNEYECRGKSMLLVADFGDLAPLGFSCKE